MGAESPEVTEPLPVQMPWAPIGAPREGSRQLSGWTPAQEPVEVGPATLPAHEPADSRAEFGAEGAPSVIGIQDVQRPASPATDYEPDHFALPSRPGGDFYPDDVDRIDAPPVQSGGSTDVNRWSGGGGTQGRDDISQIAPPEYVGGGSSQASATDQIPSPPLMDASSIPRAESGRAPFEAREPAAGRADEPPINHAGGHPTTFALPAASLEAPWRPTGGPHGGAAAPGWWRAPGQPLWPPGPPGGGPVGGSGPQPPPIPTHANMPQPVHPFRMPPSLDEVKVVDRRRYAPQSGWRRALHRATGGYVNVGDSRRQRQHQDLLSQIRQPIAGDFRIAVLSIKGGVGKTTTTLGLGSSLAMVRRDRVIAVDANPDRGTLAERVRDVSTNSTVRDLLNDPTVDRYADIRCHTRMTASRLEVLASEQEPGAAEVFDETDYRRTIDILGHHYNVILTDCGTGIMHSAMAGVLDLAHSIVLVSSPAIDAVRSASATLDWLVQHGYSTLVREAHVVLSASRPGSAALKLDRVYEFFGARCRSIHFIPFDPHLAQGTDVDVELLKPNTRQAYLDLAGAVAQNFSVSHAAPRRDGI